MSVENMTRFKQILVANERHVTNSRMGLFTILDKNPPLSVREIMKLSDGTIDRVSLYRNMELFEKLDIIHRVHLGWKYKIELTDHFIAHHHHLTCMKCGKIIDIEGEATISSFISQIANRHDFVPIRHQFEIEGYCMTCKA